MSPRRTALITGASRGIGLGIATYLAEQGYNLTLAARDGERLEAVAQTLRATGSQVTCVPGDMASDADVATLAEVAASVGRLDALVLAAGVGTAGPLADYPTRRLDKQLAVNFRAPFLLLAACLPQLRAAAINRPETGAKVVALASFEGVYPEPGVAAYAASKAALISLCQSVNLEEAANGVSACAISPAFVDTDMATWVHDRIGPEQMIAVADLVELVGAVLRMSPRAVIPHVIVHRAGSAPYGT